MTEQGAEGMRQAAEWTALLLAGQRPEGDPLAAHFGQEWKALLPIAGKPMLMRVVSALLASDRIGRVVILAQEPERLIAGDTARLAEDPRVRLATSQGGIASSIAGVAGSDTAPWPILVTTADNPLLTPDMVREFLDGAATFDLAVGVGARSLVERSYPETRRTWLKFSDDHYSGANLFALRGPATAPALALWSTIEKDRKKSWRILSSFGPRLLLRALTRTIGLDAALLRAGKRLGVRAGAVRMRQAEAVMDVDKVSDFELAESILAQRECSG
jgi:GTP:adenosylcobinamide-phosphate guanylyltransferase